MKKQKEPEWKGYDDTWLVMPDSELTQIKRSYSSMSFWQEVKHNDRSFSEAVKTQGDKQSYLVWTGSKLKLVDDYEKAREACTGETSIIFVAKHIVHNEHKSVHWTETKETKFD